ncbi:MAG: alpha/beta hydrolase [bacterium]|nr:alpha/beta hydrolase [bacterium]
MATRRRRRLLGVVGALALLLLAVAGLWAGQRRLIYFPDGDTPSLDLVGPGWVEVSYATSDDLTLTAWYHAPNPGRPIVIVLNGNAGNRGDRAALGRGLNAAGFGVLLTDYRAYGGNRGNPTEDGLALDARAAVGFVAERTSGSPLVYFGESLGAAVAVELAVTHPPAALVLRSPFTSLADMGHVHYPWLPVGLLLKDRYPSHERMESVHAPTLVIAGAADSIVPIEQSREIYAAAPEPKHFMMIPGADHNDPELGHGASMIDTVTAFIARSVAD